ncbi:MAG: molybdenum cofactor biosynthesis protein MoaB, partial [Coriobacteriales bacterium]|nr:molybdenum cofactor biosynthesis protein MoaB [Coriobacteriales bacterium]
MIEVRIGLLTASDTRTPETDTSGAALRELVEARGWTVVGYELVPDAHDAIYRALERLSDLTADVILTSGGT